MTGVETEQERAAASARTQAAIDSLDGALVLETMMFRHMADAFVEAFGNEGTNAVREGLRNYGLWRGRRMRQQHAASGHEVSVRDMLEHWTTGDIVLLHAAHRGMARGNRSRGELAIHESPEAGYLTAAGSAHLIADFYALTYAGIADGYAPNMRVNVPPDFAPGPDQAIEWRLDDDTAGEAREASDLPAITRPTLEDPATFPALIRGTIQNRSALFVTLSRAIIGRFDVAGEHAVREGIRRAGAERGTGQRERHVAEGKQPTLRTLMSDFDVPIDDAWEWRDQYLSDGVWFQDCTFCPHIPVWKELDALDLGYIYDVEIHQSQFQAYHPDIRVQWETLQTRGSAECRFRFTIPALRGPDEPSFGGPTDR